MLFELESLSLDQLLQQRQIFNAHLKLTSHLNVEITKALIRKLFVKILDTSGHKKISHNNITQECLRHLIDIFHSPEDIQLNFQEDTLKLIQ